MNTKHLRMVKTLKDQIAAAQNAALGEDSVTVREIPKTGKSTSTVFTVKVIFRRSRAKGSKIRSYERAALAALRAVKSTRRCIKT